MLNRRTTIRLLGSIAAATSVGGAGVPLAEAADAVVKVGVNVSLTGALAEGATLIKNAVVMAADEANRDHAVPGYRIELLILDDGTATTGQYDPAQAATNARKMVADTAVVAAVGPMASGSGKAMAPILSQGNLAIITPIATNPDITDPKFAAQYRPAGKPIFFRTCTTDAFQGPALANYFSEVLDLKTVYVLDDSGAYGIGTADAFQKQAENKGIKILGRDQLDPKGADYTAILTKIKQLGPDALYFGGVGLAAVKLLKQAHDIVPDIIKGGGDGLYGSDLLTAVGFPAIEGLYATLPTPHLAEDGRGAQFLQRYKDRFGMGGSDTTILAYDATLVAIEAIRAVAATGSPVTRDAVRDAIQSAKVETIQGVVSFDENGDIKDHSISVFQVRKDDSKPLDDLRAQYKYVGAAPQSL